MAVPAAVAAEPDQSRRAAVAAGHTAVSRFGIAVAAVAVQNPGGAAVGIRGRASGSVSDQRASQQHFGTRIDSAQNGLLRVGEFGTEILCRAPIQQRDKLLVERSSLPAEGLIRLTMGAKHGGDGRRNLVGRCGRDAGSREIYRRVG
ncbi:hypothetical protein Mkiyose1665_49370 [Mycobacterium kiyosense]|nr:hypothetical protein Mkiyose1665_49370 [Mycobacterium kiyosense]